MFRSAAMLQLCVAGRPSLVTQPKDITQVGPAGGPDLCSPSQYMLLCVTGGARNEMASDRSRHQHGTGQTWLWQFIVQNSINEEDILNNSPMTLG